MAPLLPRIVGKKQNTFIAMRSTLDNIAFVQEIIYSIVAYKRNKSIIVLKIDIEKVFDKINWNSVIQVFSVMHFPACWIN